jgi:hypothetical protein
MTDTVQFDSFENRQIVQSESFDSLDAQVRNRIAANAHFIFENRFNMAQDSIAADALTTAGALGFARQLEHVYAGVLKEVYEDLNANTLIPTDTSVPAGARTHTIRREAMQGRAVIYSESAEDQGNVSISNEEQEFRIWPVVTQMQISFFDELADNFASLNLRSRMQEAMRRVMEEKRNDLCWVGDNTRGIRGMLNADYIPRASSGVTFGPGGGTPEAQLMELHRLANIQAIRTKNKFSPNVMYAPIQYLDYFSNQRLNTAGGDRTILEAFKMNNRRVREIVEVHELDGQGELAGYDKLLFTKRGDQKAAAAVIPRGFTMLPAQKGTTWKTVIPAYMLWGGVVQRDPLNNLLVESLYAE